MKKFFAVMLSVMLSLSFFSFACDKPEEKEEVSVKYFQQASDMLPMLKQGVLDIGLLPEPAATQLTKVASDKTWYKTNLQELYDSEAKSYPQAVILVKQSLLNTYPDLVSRMASAFDANVQWTKDNIAQAVNAINTVLPEGVAPSLKAPMITADVIDGCNIYWQGATNSINVVKNYINDIMAIEPTSAKAVCDDLFYNGQAQGEFVGDTVKVVAPDGAPALVIAKFINDNENFGKEKTFSYSVVMANTIGSAVQKGEGDIVILPVNAATKLYKANVNDAYKLISVVTHGNLYIMSTEKINSIKDIKDKTIGVIGQGLVPDLTFKAVLKKNSMSVKIA